ncbi:MAG TPA: NfeD family protein [Candidatus Nanopelagicaceae bacterium]|jgi:membrane protein implicated in regulation of membrane protease activity
MHYWIWLALAGGFLVLEMVTLSLIFLSFALAALVGAIFAALWVGSSYQWIGFSVAAVLTLAFIRPFVRKYLFRNSSGSATGMEALLNHAAVALTDINSTMGTIRLRDETWTARCETGAIPSGSQVVVTRIDGAVAIVVPKISSTSV